MALMSVSTERHVAEDYATKDGAQASLLFQLSVPSFMHTGADISAFSCFPGEKEVRRPPAAHRLYSQ